MKRELQVRFCESAEVGLPRATHLICHCRSLDEAQVLWNALKTRFESCGLVLHPVKTKIVFCKDKKRHGDFPDQTFDFLGYTFRPRLTKWPDGECSVSFLPAASPKALKAIRQTVRGWKLHHRTGSSLVDLARKYNLYIQGWINYYSHFYKSVLYPTLLRIDAFLVKWARCKYKLLRRRPKAAREWLVRVRKANPRLFAHWRLMYGNCRTSGAV